MMKAQEIYEKEGFIVWGSWFSVYEIGEVVEEMDDDAILPQGYKAVIMGELTREEAIAWAQRNGLPAETTQRHFYKVVAE